MPIMDGYESTEKIRSFLALTKSNMPQIIACTGHIEDQYIKKAWMYKMDEILAKPISVEQLETVLEEIVDYQIEVNLVEDE